MRIRTAIAIGVITCLAASTSLLGCREEGPAERLGRALDEAGEDLSDSVQDEMESALEAVEEFGEETSDRIKRGAEEAADSAHSAIDEALADRE